MDVNSAIGAYQRALTDSISISRTGTSYAATNVRSRCKGYTPQQIAGTIMQGDQLVIVLKGDLDGQNYPTPLKGDKVVIQGRTVTVQDVDQNTRKIGQTVIAYNLQCRG